MNAIINGNSHLVNGDGSVIAEASSNDIGTGIQTVVVLAVAEAHGTEPSNVTFRWGDSRLPAAGPVYGSSQTVGMGSAVRFAAIDARKKLAACGAADLGPLDLVSLMKAASVSEIVGEVKFGFPDDASASMNGSGTPYAMQTWGANFVEVGVDRDLGIIRLRRVVARYSARRIINPMAARSQMIGGIIWE